MACLKLYPMIGQAQALVCGTKETPIDQNTEYAKVLKAAIGGERSAIVTQDLPLPTKKGK